MANIDVDIAGRRYNVACRDGEEEHLRSLAAVVDKRAKDAAEALGGLTEAFNDIADVRRHRNPNLEVLGVVFTNVDGDERFAVRIARAIVGARPVSVPARVAGIDDRMGRIAPGYAGDLVQQIHIHELTERRPGQLLQLVSIQHPTGGTPAWAEAYLLCKEAWTTHLSSMAAVASQNQKH